MRTISSSKISATIKVSSRLREVSNSGSSSRRTKMKAPTTKRERASSDDGRNASIYLKLLITCLLYP